MKVHILSKAMFEKAYPKIKDRKDLFFISILDPDNKVDSLFRGLKTWKFYDLEEDIATYKAMTFEQAVEINDYIKENLDKTLVIHCTAGVSRSGAIGEHYWELLGGSYKELIKNNPNVMPSGRVLTYLRVADKQ